MKRNPLLRSALLFVVCLFTALVPAAGPATAQEVGTNGQLLAVDAQGKSPGQCPLKHTEVKTEISGFLARVTVTQQFENPFSDKIEAVYAFPLPQAAAVDDMSIVVGDRTIKGKIMRREEAQATYEAARAKGQVAALLNQQRPNIFTQAVANILPGQQIKVTISYVETLKYDEGSYEWSFPMVVDPRYIPNAAKSSLSDQAATANERVPDADQISPPEMPKGMRAGHDISIEVTLDAGVPLVGFHSQTHEIDALQPSQERAVVRLRDQVTIPNQDFVFKYDVAGAKVEDALLMHRQANDGYFTFVLQPPMRVTAADVMPKELVFVLDTSGSMEGFPIERAKETMMLALDGLYPQDTFNLILFSGDTKVLFDDPVPATAENLKKAKKLLAQAKGDGGTEMMKAIRAALAPSDAQDHVRITCFMTDGQVGNDMEIIAEVQKHPQARVFAMGFGRAPNRFLLDKITEYGRGEVDYVSEGGDTKDAARRFHERIRNPLLTDVSIDWNGLPVTDVYPRSIPDLFSAKPVIISGRYVSEAKGTIRLKGMMAGHPVVREIPVDFKGQETQHDVLATLWARRKVDDLMGQDMQGLQVGKMKDELKKEITHLGLAYRMMTQFTSFVAVEDSIVTDNVAPRRVDVPVEVATGSASCAGVNCTVTVTAQDATVDVTSGNLSSTVSVRVVGDLPIQGRAFHSFVLLTPGSVSPGPTDPTGSPRLNVAINGQRSTMNQITIDGINSNFGISPGGQSPGASASGSAPALTATGGTNPVASIDATQELTIRAQSNNAEYGGNTGGQISVITKSGTNKFHGSAFYFFDHERLDANDWFANSRALLKPRHRLNDFGGTLGGPIQRDKTFFFTSFEGFRLRQPEVAFTAVPSIAARQLAPPDIRGLLDLYPLPNGPARPDGFAPFTTAFANAGRHDSGSLRIDRFVGNNLSLSAFYNLTDSGANERGRGGSSLNTLNRISNRSQSFTAAANFTTSPRVAGEMKLNYSHLVSRSSFVLDNFGGATLPSAAPDRSFTFDLGQRNARLISGEEATSTQRQLNAQGAITVISGAHTEKFGANYRRLFPIIGSRPSEQSVIFNGVSQALSGEADQINFLFRAQPQRPVFMQFSAYAQDEWKTSSRLTLTYGLRWELSPAPNSSSGALAVTNFSNPSQLDLAPAGRRLWKTTYSNFAPRFGVAYSPSHDDGLVIRGGFGILYDLTNSAIGDTFADSYPFLKGQSLKNAPFPLGLSPVQPQTVSFSAFDPGLKLPYSLQWNFSVERALGSRQTISAAYVGASDKRLLLTNTLVNQNLEFPFLRLTDNGGSSVYHSLQFQFKRRFSKRLGAAASYSLAKSIDNFSEDSTRRALFRSNATERGASDFDIRHTITGFASYEPQAVFSTGFGNLLTRNWGLHTVFNVRSATPVNVVYAMPTSLGFLYLRPDVVSGVPLYLDDTAAAGGRRLNPAAFVLPLDFRQGTLGRNALRGFSLSQVNFALRRRFIFTEGARLTVGLEALNLFNHPNFAAPAGDDASLGIRFGNALLANHSFGQSLASAGAMASGFGADYYPGAARTLRLALKFEF